MGEDITERLETLVEEIRDLIRWRQKRIKELKEEIESLEDSNDELQKQVSSLFENLKD
jgi:uncharacterized protein Yka (UPF0111/DUF47 family)